MSVNELNGKLNAAYRRFCEEATDTCSSFQENAQLHKALHCVYEDIGKVLTDFQDALIAYLKE